jgi:hypothetical protein
MEVRRHGQTLSTGTIAGVLIDPRGGLVLIQKLHGAIGVTTLERQQDAMRRPERMAQW